METLKKMASEHPESQKALENALDPSKWLEWYKEHGKKEVLL
jgi:hypothetical protein